MSGTSENRSTTSPTLFVPINRSIKYLYCVRVLSAGERSKRSNHDVHFSSTTTTQLIMIEIIAGSLPYLDNPHFIFAVPICYHLRCWLTRIRRRWCIRCDDIKIHSQPTTCSYHRQLSTGDWDGATDIAATRYMYSHSGCPLLADSDPSIHRKHTKLCNIILSFITHLHEHASIA